MSASEHFLTASRDAWWLRFRLSGHKANVAAATTTSVDLDDKPLGNPASGALNGTAFSVEAKRTTGGIYNPVNAWQSILTAYYDAAAGTVDVPLTLMTVNMFDGERLFVRLIANGEVSDTLIAYVEIVNLVDKNRDQTDGVEVCDDDEAISFRITADGQVSHTYVGTTIMSGGALYEYALRLRDPSVGIWGSPATTTYDPKTGIVDAVIASAFAYSEYGDALEYKLTPYGSDTIIASGQMVYAEDCNQPSDPADPPTVFNLVSDGSSRLMRFRIIAFGDISQAKVASVTLESTSAIPTGTAGIFTLQYKLDNAPAWSSVPVYFRGSEGVAEVNIKTLLDAAVKTIQFRLVQ